MNLDTIVNAVSNRFSALLAPLPTSNDKANASSKPEQPTNIVFKHMPHQINRREYNSFLTPNANNQQVVPDMNQIAFPPIANDDWVAVDDDDENSSTDDVFPSYLNTATGTGDDCITPDPIEEPNAFKLPQGWSRLTHKSSKPRPPAKNYAEIGRQIVDTLTQKHQSFIAEYNSIHGSGAYEDLYWLPPVYGEEIWHDRQNDFSNDVYE